MSKKTKRHHRHNKKNINTRKHRKRHTYRNHRRSHPYRKHRKRHTYKKHRQIVIIPGNKGIPLFTDPDKKKPQKIMVNQRDIQSGNMIMGLRNM